MREIRTYGSEGGAAGKPAVPTPIARLDVAASHLEVFGEGPGEGVFAKTPSPETRCLLSYHYAGNDVFALFFHSGINFVCINAVKAFCGFI